MRNLVLIALVLVAPLLSAHPTGDEARKPADCAKYAPPMRGHCVECVSRPRPHHFHASLPPGERCRPNDGQP